MKNPQTMTSPMKIIVSMAPGQGEKSMTTARMSTGSPIHSSHRLMVIQFTLFLVPLQESQLMHFLGVAALVPGAGFEPTHR